MNDQEINLGKISFSTSSGILTIEGTAITAGTPVPFTHDFKNEQALWLRVVWGAGGDWPQKIIIRHSIAGDLPDFTSTVPFGIWGDFAEMKFGLLKARVKMHLKETNGNDWGDPIIVGDLPGFYLGFIGTDDLRNGRVNPNFLNLKDGKDLYLRMKKVVVEQEEQAYLEVGQMR